MGGFSLSLYLLFTTILGGLAGSPPPPPVKRAWHRQDGGHPQGSRLSFSFNYLYPPPSLVCVRLAEKQPASKKKVLWSSLERRPASSRLLFFFSAGRYRPLWRTSRSGAHSHTQTQRHSNCLPFPLLFIVC